MRSDRKRRGPWSNITAVLIKKEKTSHLRGKALWWWRHRSQCCNCLRRAHQKIPKFRKKRRRTLPYRFQRQCGPADTLALASGTMRRKFCHFKASRLQSFVRIATGSQWTSQDACTTLEKHVTCPWSLTFLPIKSRLSLGCYCKSIRDGVA